MGIGHRVPYVHPAAWRRTGTASWSSRPRGVIVAAETRPSAPPTLYGPSCGVDEVLAERSEAGASVLWRWSILRWLTCPSV